MNTTALTRLPDTQNQAWAKDNKGFGFRMLQRMGWSEGKGLGKEEDGTVTHVRVKKRSEQLALGATVADLTGNASLSVAVQDFNSLLASLCAVGGESKFIFDPIRPY
jgi:Pin2-interacting protein X1